jgi:hypothetical protein
MNRELAKVQKIAKAKGLPEVSVSKAVGKRFSVKSPSGKLLNFGQWPYRGKGTFIDHEDEKIRAAWRARHSKIMKNGKPAYLNPESPEYYSWNLLW